MDTIVFGSSDPTQSARIGRAVADGTLRKIAPRIYTSDLVNKPELVCRQNIWQILSHVCPGATISHRTALEGRISDHGTVYLTAANDRRLDYPGVTVYMQKGPPALVSDQPFLGSLRLSSPARALLENLQRSRTTAQGSKTLSLAEIEAWLDRQRSLHGAQELIALRATARTIAGHLHMEHESDKLHAIVAALLGSGPADKLATDSARASVAGVPYDAPRIQLFAQLAAFLKNTPLPSVAEKSVGPDAAQNEAFFESYFSNFIEGTEFELEEAERIVFQSLIPASRPKDAHDIIGTYRLAASAIERRRFASSPDEFLALIRSWHATMMGARPEVRPGEFKTRANRVGSRVFVAPEHVRGTFHKAWELAESLTHPFGRALYWKFAFTEIHPFDDGNGRLSRLILNAHLTATGLSRIIVPQVFREDYLTTLTALTNNGNARPYLAAMERLQTFTAKLPFADYQAAKDELTRRNAFRHPSEAKLIWDGLAPASPATPAPNSAGDLIQTLADADAPLPTPRSTRAKRR